MQVRVLEETWTFANNENDVNRMFSEIEQLLHRNELNLSHLIVNGLDVYTDFQSCILDQLKDVVDVTFVVETADEAQKKLIISTEEFLNRAIPQLDFLSAQFYQGPDSEAWGTFIELIDSIQWINQLTHSLSNTESNSEFKMQWSDFSEELGKKIVPNLMEAVEMEDQLLIGDCLTYEISPFFKKFNKFIQQILDHKVVKPNVN